MAIRITPLTGQDLQGALPDLARLRMDVFRRWPYLYDGTLDYERRYVERFAAAPRSVVIAAYDSEYMIGAATASPIADHMTEFAQPLLDAGIALAPIFYFGESVLLTEYRGQGVGHAFFDQREAHARQFAEYHFAAFCAVERPADHPQKDPGYRPLDGFWMKRGYYPLRGITGRLAWKDIGADQEADKAMRYWIRAL